MGKPLLYYTPDSPPCQVSEKLQLIVIPKQYCFRIIRLIIIHPLIELLAREMCQSIAGLHENIYSVRRRLSW